ncbi:MAG TPA: matrixin family metalloprotease [Hyphomicrobiales bacterium]|nr:matrixin family metalloprotease [Hyphomicrobiales bacterium]
MKPLWRGTATVLLVLAGLGTALAFQRGNGVWPNARTTFFTGLSGVAVSGGGTFAQAFRDAMTTWNDNTAFHFVADPTYRDPCAGYSRAASGKGFPAGEGDGYNGAGFSADVCGNAFGEGVLAITLSGWMTTPVGSRQMQESDIVFNSAVSWDLFDGPRRGSAQDFYRVALHELGHALGLDHELKAEAIMQPRIGTLRHLTADDINGVNTLYGAPPLTCTVATAPRNGQVAGALTQDDCRVFELFGGSDDDSPIDAYRLVLDKTTDLSVDLRSPNLEPVLLLASAQLSLLDIFSAPEGSCTVNATMQLPAGEYLLLVNTYIDPRPCGGPNGDYLLSVMDTQLPLLGDVRASEPQADVSGILFQGGVSKDGGQVWDTHFAATDALLVRGRVRVKPEHVGRPGHLYVVAVLSNGMQFMRDASGRFLPFNGQLSTLVPAYSGALQDVETLDIATGITGLRSGLAGLGVSVFIGYASAGDAEPLYYLRRPFYFSIAAP